MYRLPPPLTEAQFLAAIDKTVQLLARSFAFAYYDEEDIAQEAREAAIKALDGYDPRRPLANFLYTHIKFRLINLKRNVSHRTDAPCSSCHGGTPCARAIEENGTTCQTYARWRSRNDRKAALAQPKGLLPSEAIHPMGGAVGDTLEADELETLIDCQLPVALRATYLKMREGIKVPAPARSAVMDEVRRILCAQAD